MNDEDFHDKVDKLFESRLKRYLVRIKDLENNKILTDKDMDYGLVLFDSDLNIYKLVGGVPEQVVNKNFKALLL
jgi:hypothetical protein